MEQATQPQPATLTAPAEVRSGDAERQEYKRASALMDRIIDQLTNLPRSAAVVGDLTGFRVQLNFGTNDPSGVLEFAEATDTAAARDRSGDGVWFEARTTIEGIPVCAEVLLSREAAAAFETQAPGPNPAPANGTPVQMEPAIVHVAAQAPVSLGASVTAYAPTTISTTAQDQPAGDEQ